MFFQNLIFSKERLKMTQFERTAFKRKKWILKECYLIKRPRPRSNNAWDFFGTFQAPFPYVTFHVIFPPPPRHDMSRILDLDLDWSRQSRPPKLSMHTLYFRDSQPFCTHVPPNKDCNPLPTPKSELYPFCVLPNQ